MYIIQFFISILFTSWTTWFETHYYQKRQQIKVVKIIQAGREASSTEEVDIEKMEPTRHTMRASKSEVSPPVMAYSLACSLVLMIGLTPPIAGYASLVAPRLLTYIILFIGGGGGGVIMAAGSEVILVAFGDHFELHTGM